MLPKELLEVRKAKGRIFPKFADERDYELANEIIRIFKGGLGKKYGNVMKLVREIENAKNFKKVRGFVRVLENHCVEKSCAFSIDSEIEPKRVRMLLFEHGFVTSKRERDRVLEYAARYFNTTPEVIEKAMYADREEELIVAGFRTLTPEELIKLYNLSLLQTVLFNALRLTFWTSDMHKEIFRAIKRLGLMYELYEDSGRMMVEVTGAATLLKMTRKYGASFAKLIPWIVRARKWYIRAEIADFERLYIMEIDDKIKDMLPEEEEQITYDSSLEEEFARKMKMLGYDIEREPDVVKAGKNAFIPDFAVNLEGRRVYIEIAGFWTEEYLKKKVEKIRNSSIPLILIAKDEFGEGRVDLRDVIIFSKKIPYGEVIKALRRYRSERNVDGDVVELSSFEEVPEGYVVAGKYAVRKDLFEKIKKEIEEVKPSTLEDIRAILKKYGLGESSLHAFGYRVRWISLGEAVIERAD